MNVPPRCEFKEAVDPECGNLAPWVVIDKTEGTIRYICHICLNLKIVVGHTYSIFPARNYSRPRRSFDREYMGEPFVPDGSRCVRCDGEMVLAVALGRPEFMVCKECGEKEGE